MLKRFEVENFKGFQNKLIFDLEAREYPFNESLVVNGIVNKALIYGKNGIGKSTLGIALFDIVGHLTDKEKMSSMYLINYINLNSNRPNARFRYCFQFDENEVIYEYEKNDPHNLVYEKIWIDGRAVLDYSYSGSGSKYIDESLCGSLNIALIDNKLSVVLNVAEYPAVTQDDTVFYGLLMPEFHAGADLAALVLCHRSHDGKSELAVLIERVDAVVLEIHRYAVCEKLSRVLNAVERVTGESRDLFGDDQIKLAVQSIIDHLVEFFTFLCRYT